MAKYKSIYGDVGIGKLSRRIRAEATKQNNDNELMKIYEYHETNTQPERGRLEAHPFNLFFKSRRDIRWWIRAKLLRYLLRQLYALIGVRKHSLYDVDGGLYTLFQGLFLYSCGLECKLSKRPKDCEGTFESRKPVLLTHRRNNNANNKKKKRGELGWRERERAHQSPGRPNFEDRV